MTTMLDSLTIIAMQRRRGVGLITNSVSMYPVLFINHAAHKCFLLQLSCKVSSLKFESHVSSLFLKLGVETMGTLERKSWEEKLPVMKLFLSSTTKSISASTSSLFLLVSFSDSLIRMSFTYLGCPGSVGALYCSQQLIKLDIHLLSKILYQVLQRLILFGEALIVDCRCN
ncbi:hypothetical protein L6452_23245 [Arctium lappa]|uniref:Uncharacterized protein n=1 Tax=Arctium lappa TaxID=4217 RepID=A0ACB9B0U5_ARCLA|nr:hypothetical protein L6452_23245 [Arctium lappa]